MKNNNSNIIRQEKIQVAIAFVFILLFLILLFSSLVNQGTAKNANTFKNITTQEKGEEILPVGDSGKFTINNSEVSLNENYRVNTIYKDSERFVCTVKDSSCIVYEVISGSNYFYLSDKEFITKDSLRTDESELVLNLNEFELIAKAKMMLVTTREFDSPIAKINEDMSLPRQVYSCVDTKYCFNSGLFNESIADNGIQLSGLIEFLNSI